jgi:hypothetical protein
MWRDLVIDWDLCTASRLFPSAATTATRFPSFNCNVRTARPSRKDGEGFATRAAETTPYPDPVVVFVMGLLAVADNGVASGVRAATRQQRQTGTRVQLECGLVLRTRQCDKENQGWREGLPLTVSNERRILRSEASRQPHHLKLWPV